MSEDISMNKEMEKKLDNLTQLFLEQYRDQQEYLNKYYPTDIPNDLCNHAFIQGIKFENSFSPKVYDFVQIMKCDDEELFIWTHSKDTDTALVSMVSSNVKNKNFWKNIGVVIQLAYSYSRDFEHTMDLKYRWCYYFNPNKSLYEHELFRDSDKFGLLNGTILKLTELCDLSPVMELLLRDDKAFTAMSIFYSSMKIHYCCLICELEKYPFRKHASHEPDIWEQANVISVYETAIVQACRCVEALIGKPPNKEKKGRFSEHKQMWVDQFGINPEDLYQKSGTTYIDFYYYLFELRNTAAHSYGTIPFGLERKQAVDAQCFASLLLDGYVMKHVIQEKEAIKKLSINQSIIEKVNETMNTSKTSE
ncbi:hypothetical protein J7E78_08765 [Paenibacillus polymyxa]|uniref:hypothetical protein n=1 Tax=Paenibacillus polymyxa TaxID=1406 RepID=UPI001BEA3199|nr:hypothetical protein [Paenibacillus polymyxa]MBT2283624.1 hypothetical protein [Paenibacillus polymyxa]